jgi:hypothetical protein
VFPTCTDVALLKKGVPHSQTKYEIASESDTATLYKKEGQKRFGNKTIKYLSLSERFENTNLNMNT